MKLNLKGDLRRGLCKSKLKLKESSPTLLILGGALVGVIAIVDYCKKSINEAAPIIQEQNEKIDDIKSRTIEEDASEEELKKAQAECKNDILNVKKETGIKLCKVYARPVALTIVSATMIGGSHYILKTRNVALMAAFTAVDNGFKMYRSRVVERFGEEVDRELRHNIKKRTIEEPYYDPETGEKGVTKSQVDVVEVDPNDPNDYSDYARFYDELCKEWTKSPEYNLTYLKARQEEANMILKRDGYLFLNTVYDMLGIPRTKAGQIVGWVYDKNNPIGDNFVDFGIYEAKRTANRDFVNGYEPVILLDFNVDGPIIEHLP